MIRKYCWRFTVIFYYHLYEKNRRVPDGVFDLDACELHPSTPPREEHSSAPTALLLPLGNTPDVPTVINGVQLGGCGGGG